MNRTQFTESEMLNSNWENIEVYVVNLNVFSIGNQCFAFNEPDSGLPVGSRNENGYTVKYGGIENLENMYALPDAFPAFWIFSLLLLTHDSHRSLLSSTPPSELTPAPPKSNSCWGIVLVRIVHSSPRGFTRALAAASSASLASSWKIRLTDFTHNQCKGAVRRSTFCRPTKRFH